MVIIALKVNVMANSLNHLLQNCVFCQFDMLDASTVSTTIPMSLDSCCQSKVQIKSKFRTFCRCYAEHDT